MKLRRLFLVLSNLLLLIPFLFHGYYGLFSRYLADDWCTAAILRSHGFLSSLGHWRTTWSGRFSFYTVMNITHAIGPWLTPFLPAVTILLWLVSLYILTGQLLRVLQMSGSRLANLLFASAILFAVLDGAPDIYQSLYWQTGLVTYTLPLVLFTAYAAFLLTRLLMKGKIHWIDLVVSAAVTLAAGGFSETYAAFQVVAILAFLLAIYLFKNGEAKKPGLLLAGSGLLGAVIATLLVVTAPGNSVRMATMPEQLGALEQVFWTLRHTLAFSAKSLINAPISALTALLIPGLLAFLLPQPAGAGPGSTVSTRKDIVPFLVGIPAAAFLLMSSSIAPSIFATAAYPAERSLITAQYILISAIAAWGFHLGLFFRANVRQVERVLTPACIILGILVLASSLISCQKTITALPDAQNFARLWDERDQNIRETVAAAGAQEMSVVSLPHISPGLGEISTDPGDWINRCFATNYGLNTVTAK